MILLIRLQQYVTTPQWPRRERTISVSRRWCHSRRPCSLPRMDAALCTLVSLVKLPIPTTTWVCAEVINVRDVSTAPPVSTRRYATLARPLLRISGSSLETPLSLWTGASPATHMASEAPSTQAARGLESHRTYSQTHKDTIFTAL